MGVSGVSGVSPLFPGLSQLPQPSAGWACLWVPVTRPVGRTIEKNETPQTRWADQYLTTHPRQASKTGGHPCYLQKRLGRPVSSPSGLGGPVSNARGGSAQKPAKSAFIFYTGAGPSQLKVGTAETILRQGVRHLRHAPVPANCLSSPPPSAGCHAKSRYRNGVGRASIETELGEPVLKKNEFRARWANQYRNGVGRTSIKNGVGRTSPAGWVDQAQPVGCQKTQQKRPLQLFVIFFDDRWQHQKTGNIFTFFSTPAPAPAS